MARLPLSLVVITLNEEAHLERCLRSVPFADEIIVVDSFSTDRTLEVARLCGARVVQEKWRGYGPQKAFATAQAKNDWVLSLDADEALSPELAQEIQDKFLALDPETGYRLPRLSFHLGRWIRHGGWYPDFQLRLFNKTKAQWDTAALHEKVEVARVATLKNNLLHWVFEDISDQVRTNDRYSSLGAVQLHEKGKKFSLFKMITKPFSKFVETYLWKRGFLDGLPGFIISVGAAYSVFLRWGKMWEIERKGKQNK
jgi:glycosyltransferase involved in cell wall biosynthesis